MGIQGGGADVYLETHGDSVFKRLCVPIMILVKGRTRGDRRYPVVRKIAGEGRDLEIQFQTNDRSNHLGGALRRSELTGSEAQSLALSSGRVH